MRENVIEKLRETVVKGLFTTDTVQRCWPIWVNKIKAIIGDNPTPQSVLGIGDNLANIFKTTGNEGRDQGELSAGGTGWESIIVWYINLCCIGTRVVAVKNMAHVPEPIKDAISVNYSNFSCTTESDITVIVFPDDALFTDSNYLKRNGKIDIHALSEKVSDKFVDFQIGIIQCKTNWNDNAQIPMLWDMIYSAGGFGARQISVGRNNFSIQDLELFTYSFVTVPTNRITNYKTTSLSVKRVINLSGGNYWGLPTSNGIARSVREIFQNYRSGFVNTDIKRTLDAELPLLRTDYKYFNIYEEEDA